MWFKPSTRTDLRHHLVSFYFFSGVAGVAEPGRLSLNSETVFRSSRAVCSDARGGSDGRASYLFFLKRQSVLFSLALVAATAPNVTQLMRQDSLRRTPNLE